MSMERKRRFEQLEQLEHSLDHKHEGGSGVSFGSSLQTDIKLFVHTSVSGRLTVLFHIVHQEQRKSDSNHCVFSQRPTD